MASTLTVVALSNDGCYLVANIGDSRAYLYRNDTLHQLTRDESLVQLLVDDGAITPEEARTHPQRSVVLHALDGAQHQEFEVSSHEAMAGDRLLLCSDGLSDVVPDPAIAEILASSSRDDAAEALLGAALSAGAADNVSFVVADVTSATDESVGWLEILTANGDDSPGTDTPPSPG
jgi:PPM family protein phosphatase